MFNWIDTLQYLKPLNFVDMLNWIELFNHLPVCKQMTDV